MLRRAALLVSIPFLGGCYSYAPIEIHQVTPAMSVRATLLEDPARGMVEGQVFEIGPSSISVLPEVSPGGSSAPRSIAFSAIDVVEQRTFDGVRTALFAGATIGLGIATLFTVDVIQGGGRSPGGPGDFSVVPLFRLPIGR